MDEMITIPLQVYIDLIEANHWLSCLEDAGVDNWEGISYAQELFDEGETKEIL